MEKERLIPRIKQEWCKGCRICADFCPRQVFERDSLGKPNVAHPENCITCYMCDYRCPDFAITLASAAVK